MERIAGRVNGILSGLLVLGLAVCVPAPADAYGIAEGLDLNGRFFGDVSLAENDADSGFHLKRAYVMLKAQLQPGFAARLTLDQRSEDDRVFVKHAYVVKDLSDHTAIQVGLAGTPYVPYDDEHFWGFRFVANSFTQMWGLQTSADLGASLLGSASNGTVAYQATLMNGEGYQNTPDGNGFAVAGRLNADVEKAHVGAWGHLERDRDGVTNYDPSRAGLFGFYEDAKVRVGGQIALANDGGAGNTGAGGAVFDSGVGVNVQGRVKLPASREAWAFARFDTVELNTGDRHMVLAGASLDVMPGLAVAPNLRLVDTGDSARGTEVTVGVHAQLLL
jgi:hypothetical protein